MIKLITTLFLIMTLAQGSDEDRLRQAEEAYYNGDYAIAIDLYNSLLLEGLESDSLHFNLGNAYFEAGRLGEALVHYKRAQRLTPRDTAINANIMRVRALRADFQGDEQFWIDRLASSTHTTLTLTELGMLALIVWTMWFSLSAIWIWRKQWRNYLGVPLVIGGIIVILSAMLFFSRQYSDYQRPQAIVTVLQADIYSGPSEEYLNIYQLYAAAELRIVETRGDWIRFVLPDGQQGWILRQHIIRI
jgi:tetratricopeptide (TPR) repeat protein